MLCFTTTTQSKQPESIKLLRDRLDATFQWLLEIHILFLFTFLQDEKNQLLQTSVWVRQVGISVSWIPYQRWLHNVSSIISSIG